MSSGCFDIVASGDDALRVLCGGGGIRHVLAQHLASSGHWVEVVPGKVDVTVAFDPHAEMMSEASARLQRAILSVESQSPAKGAQQSLLAKFGGAEGPDLAFLAQHLDILPEVIIARVEQSLLSVDMLGFTPGFAYLTGLDPALQASRLDHPRGRVPAGSIGMISGQIGLYALDGPGGWPIIGRVVSPLFDRSRPDPFVLKAGDAVSLRRVMSS